MPDEGQNLTLAIERRWEKAFLVALSKEANVSEACRKAKIARGYAYQVRGEDAAFSARWDEAIETAVDALEKIAFQRARRKSDKLLIALLAAHRPEKYSRRKVIDKRHSGKVQHVHTLKSDLAPYADAIRDLVAGRLGAPGSGVSTNGVPKPLDTQSAN